MARAAAAPSSLTPASEMPEFTFAQCFGDRDGYSVVNQDDVLSGMCQACKYSQPVQAAE